jgi:hypothetical protein
MRPPVFRAAAHSTRSCHRRQPTGHRRHRRFARVMPARTRWMAFQRDDPAAHSFPLVARNPARRIGWSGQKRGAQTEKRRTRTRTLGWYPAGAYRHRGARRRRLARVKRTPSRCGCSASPSRSPPNLRPATRPRQQATPTPVATCFALQFRRSLTASLLRDPCWILSRPNRPCLGGASNCRLLRALCFRVPGRHLVFDVVAGSTNGRFARLRS